MPHPDRPPRALLLADPVALLSSLKASLSEPPTRTHTILLWYHTVVPIFYFFWPTKKMAVSCSSKNNSKGLVFFPFIIIGFFNLGKQLTSMSICAFPIVKPSVARKQKQTYFISGQRKTGKNFKKYIFHCSILTRLYGNNNNNYFFIVIIPHIPPPFSDRILTARFMEL